MPGTLSVGILWIQFVDFLGRANIARRSLRYGQRLDQEGNFTSRLFWRGSCKVTVPRSPMAIFDPLCRPGQTMICEAWYIGNGSAKRAMLLRNSPLGGVVASLFSIEDGGILLWNLKWWFLFYSKHGPCHFGWFCK